IRNASGGGKKWHWAGGRLVKRKKRGRATASEPPEATGAVTPTPDAGGSTTAGINTRQASRTRRAADGGRARARPVRGAASRGAVVWWCVGGGGSAGR